MKAKGKAEVRDVRYVPIDEATYPEQGEDDGVVFFRFWCRPLFVVYEKYKNGVKLGYLVMPDGKDIFQFDQMIKYAEAKTRGETVCRVRTGS